LVVTDRLLELQWRREWAVEEAFQKQSFRIWVRVAPYEGASRARVSRELNGGRPLVGPEGTETYNLAPASPSELFRYGVPVTNPSGPHQSFRTEIRGTDLGPDYAGWVLHMHFIDDRLVGAYTLSPPRTPYAGPPAALVILKRFEPVLLWAAVVLWLGCALIVPFNLAWRRDIGRVALAAVLTAALLVWLEPSALPHAVERNALRAWVIAGMLAIVMIVLPRRRVCRPDASCGKCGYDLTGNISGVCPECGTPTPQGLIDRWRDEAERIEHVDELGQSVEAADDTAETLAVEAPASADRLGQL
jgi:hypothetical protein